MNVYAGKSQQWLEAKLAAAQDDLAAGKSRISVREGEVSSQFQREQSIHATISELLYALYLIDPTTYPLATSQRVTRTKIFVQALRENAALPVY